MTSNASLFRRYEAAQLDLVKRSAPATPEQTYDLPDIDQRSLLRKMTRERWERKGAR